MEQNKKSKSLYVIKWETIQLIFLGLFLFILYMQENRIIDAIKSDTAQRRGILEFLNGMQFPLLPDFFFFLFFPILLVSISLIILKKWRWYFLALMGAMLATLLTADKIYHSFFTSVITFHSFSAAGQIGDVRSAIVEAIQWTDLFYIIFFGVFIPFGIFYNNRVSMHWSRSRMMFAIDKILGVLFFLLAIYCFNIAFFIPKRYVTINTDNIMQVSQKKSDFGSPTNFKPMYESSDMEFATTFGLTNFHVTNLVEGLLKKQAVSKYKDTPPPKQLGSFFDHKYQLNKIDSPFNGVAKGKNVFLIHFESLNPAIIGLNLGGESVTPTLDRLVADGFYWNYILDQVRIGGSSDAEFSALTGMLPSTTQISAFNASCMPYIPSLPRTLRSHAYQTISLHGYKSSFWNRNTTHPLLGFDKMYFKEAYHYEKRIGLGISDKAFLSQAVDLLGNHQPPFFAFLMTLTSHYPYHDLPENYGTLFDETFPEDSLLKSYLQSIRYTDDALGEFFAKIKRVGLLGNSIFVIYGDHRPGSDEEMNNELVKITGKSLYNSRSSCVPIIIAIPGQESHILKFKKDYQKTVGGLYDIFPTIMHLLGIESPFGLYGSHLFVKNAQRDPVPFYRFADSFIYNGIQYIEQGRKIATDKLGIIFTDDKNALGLNISETHRLWKQAQLSIHVSNYIYASNTKVASLKQ